MDLNPPHTPLPYDEASQGGVVPSAGAPSVSDFTGTFQSPVEYTNVHQVAYPNYIPLANWAPPMLAGMGLTPTFPLFPARCSQYLSMIPLQSRGLSFCDCGCGGGPRVPQRPYNPPRSLEDFIPSECITFTTAGRCGILVAHVLNESFRDLDGRDDPVLVDSGTSISLRFEWPGCEPWSTQIKTQDWRKDPNPINRSKLATEIVKKLGWFIRDTQDKPQSDPEWRVGPGFIESHRLVLLSLKHVSKGSWQPHFRLIN